LVIVTCSHHGVAPASRGELHCVPSIETAATRTEYMYGGILWLIRWTRAHRDRAPFEHGGHVLRAVKLSDGNDLCSTSTSIASLGAVSAQSSVATFASDFGQSKASSPLTSAIILGPLDPSVIKAQTTIVVMPGRPPLLGESAPLWLSASSKLPAASRPASQPGHLRAPAAKPVITVPPPPIDQGWD